MPLGMPAAPAVHSNRPHLEISVLDVIFIALTIALFALVGLVAKGVEKL